MLNNEAANIEVEKTLIEMAKMVAETRKANAETKKITLETFWYPVAIAGGLVGSTAAATALIIKFF